MTYAKDDTPPKNISVAVITMGCSKNLVDSENLIKHFATLGIDVEHNPQSLNHNIAVVNTCGFIGDAKEESINMILSCVDAKNHGRVDKVAVMGCLSQRYRRELMREIPEVDNWYGKFDWDSLAADVSGAKTTTRFDNAGRVITTVPHMAYIKVSEGCNRFCAFCAIPLITGRHKSRSIPDIVDEVTALVKQGVKEFNIVAQDLSAYGTDFPDGKHHLAQLLTTLSDIPGVEWIRLHYAYPADFPVEILPVMASRKNICKYLDIALQHASDKVLSDMRRHISIDETRELLDQIRREVPGIHLRTTMMVGFPGETDSDFQELLNFVGEQRFERLGAFAYSEEDDTFAAKNYTDDVPADVKQKRLDELMALQEDIDTQISESKVGQTLRVICDGSDSEFYICRSEFDSPDVDPTVLVPRKGTKPMIPGQFYDVVVVDGLTHDLIAHISNS